MNEQPKHNTRSDDDAKHDPKADYLTQQASEASAAISAAFGALADDLKKGVDPQAWAKRYPWAAVGAAAVAGFFAASAAVPSKEQQALKKLERIERALRPSYPEGEPYPQAVAAREGQAKAQDKSFASKIMSEIFSALKPALSSALAAGISAKAASGDGSSGGNGDAAAQGAGHGAGHAAGLSAYHEEEEQRRREA